MFFPPVHNLLGGQLAAGQNRTLSSLTVFFIAQLDKKLNSEKNHSEDRLRERKNEINVETKNTAKCAHWAPGAKINEKISTIEIVEFEDYLGAGFRQIY